MVVRLLLKERLDEVRDGGRLDDAARAPNCDDLGVVQAPSFLLVGFGDDLQSSRSGVLIYRDKRANAYVHALNVGSQDTGVHREPDILNKRLDVESVFALELSRLRELELVRDDLARTAGTRRQAELVCSRDRRSGDVPSRELACRNITECERMALPLSCFSCYSRTDHTPVPSELSISCVTLSSMPSTIPVSRSMPAPFLNRMMLAPICSNRFRAGGYTTPAYPP